MSSLLGLRAPLSVCLSVCVSKKGFIHVYVCPSGDVAKLVIRWIIVARQIAAETDNPNLILQQHLESASYQFGLRMERTLLHYLHCCECVTSLNAYQDNGEQQVGLFDGIIPVNRTKFWDFYNFVPPSWFQIGCNWLFLNHWLGGYKHSPDLIIQRLQIIVFVLSFTHFLKHIFYYQIRFHRPIFF